MLCTQGNVVPRRVIARIGNLGRLPQASRVWNLTKVLGKRGLGLKINRAGCLCGS